MQVQKIAGWVYLADGLMIILDDVPILDPAAAIKVVIRCSTAVGIFSAIPINVRANIPPSLQNNSRGSNLAFCASSKVGNCFVVRFLSSNCSCSFILAL